MAISSVSGVARTHAVRAIKPEAETHTVNHATRAKTHEQKRVDVDDKAAELEPAPDGEHHIHVVA